MHLFERLREHWAQRRARRALVEVHCARCGRLFLQPTGEPLAALCWWCAEHGVPRAREPVASEPSEPEEPVGPEPSPEPRGAAPAPTSGVEQVD